MKRTTRIVMVAIACTLACTEKTAAQGGTTVEELVAAAIERAPDILAARTAIEAARGQLSQAELRLNPEVTTTQRELTSGTHETMIGVEWPLDLFRRTGRVTTAQQIVEAETLSVQDRERQLAAAVREQAGRALAASRNLEIMNDALTATRRIRDLMAQRAAESQAPRVDANVVEIEASRLEADQALAAGDAEVAIIELKALAGLAADAPFMLTDSLESLVGAPSTAPAQTATTEPAQTATTTPAQTAAIGLEERPDIRAAKAQVAVADARIEEARRRGLVDLRLSASYDCLQLGFPQLGFDVGTGRQVPIENLFQGLIVSGNLVVPLWNRNQGAVAAARAERSGASETLAARELGARAELDAAMAQDDAARRAVDLYALNIRDLARQDVDVALESYDVGRTPMSDLLAEQRRYLEVETAYTTVLSRAYQARVALRRAQGEIR